MGDRRLREAISKVRMSSHLFYIERGRWGKPIIERVDRLCDVCNVIEDEKHCLLECPKYVNERRERLPEWLRIQVGIILLDFSKVRMTKIYEC